MYNKEFIDSQKNKIAENIKISASDKYKPAFHISPITGWLNDPNGLCQFEGTYHIYFQYDPVEASRKNIIWGHVRTDDFLTYSYEEPFIYADSNLDKDGAYSGSAFIKDDEIHYFYTGNVKHEGDYDYIHDGRDHNTIKLVSKDGFKFDEKKLVLSNDDYPSDLTRHVRDPKVYEEDGIYYMFLGARDNNDKGKVLVFKSSDLENFTYHMDITTDYDFGYMWECPDFFKIGDKYFLMISPQGLKSEKYKYQNIYQSGYFPIDINLAKKTYTLGDFIELDFGFDFYAPQTFEDEKGRRILIGWMGMPDAEYINPTVENKWQHCLTIPRELEYRDGKLVQNPIMEMKDLRIEDYQFKLDQNKSCNLDHFEFIANNNGDDFEIDISDKARLIYDEDLLTLELGDDGYGRDIRRVRIHDLFKIRILRDRSSIEIFLNDGEYVLSSRFYPKEISFNASLPGLIFELKPIKWVD